MRREFVFGTLFAPAGRLRSSLFVLESVWGPRRKVDFVRRRVPSVFFLGSGLFFGSAEVVINDQNQARFAYCFMHLFLPVYQYLRGFFCFFCVIKTPSRGGFFAGFPPGWLAGWLGHRHRRHFYSGWVIARIGCALEFRSRRYFGSRGAEYVAWVRLGRWILCAGACLR